MINQNRIFAYSVAAWASLFVFFAVAYWSYSQDRALARLERQSQVIANAMWTYEHKDVLEYLKLACSTSDYSRLLASHRGGDIFVFLEHTPQSPLDRLLISIGVIRPVTISSPVIHQGKVIGKLSVTWNNTAIYVYLYFFSLMFLISLALRFYLFTLMAKQNLQSRVEDRTAKLRQEISERLEIESALRESESKYKMLIDNLPQNIFYKNTDSIYITCNDNYAQDLGTSPIDIAGKTDFDFFPAELAEKYRQDDRRIVLSGQMEEIEEKYIQNGKERIIKTIKTTVTDADGNVSGLLGIFWDITKQKSLESQLQHAQKMESIGILAGGIAHDFNNILSAIIGFTELAIDDAQEGRFETETLSEILVAAERAKKLVLQILTFSRKSELDLQPINMNRHVRQSVKLLQRTIPKMVKIETRLAGDLKLIQADATQLEQVLMNLVSNAKDAMPEGGLLLIETQNKILDEEYCRDFLKITPGDYVLLSVSDNGTGMDEETIKHIFDPFFTTKEVGRGTGLGMSTIYGIVKSHAGHISCSSQLGQGSTFKIYIPAILAQAASALVHGPKSTEVAGGRETILVIDDEENIRTITQQVLQRLGYLVLTAKNGEEGLYIFSAHDGIDLVILDVGMPGMGGHQCLAGLLKLNPQAKVIMASGYSSTGQLKNTLDSGASDYLAKPFKRNQLLSTVRLVLDSPEPQPQIARPWEPQQKGTNTT